MRKYRAQAGAIARTLKLIACFRYIDHLQRRIALPHTRQRKPHRTVVLKAIECLRSQARKYIRTDLIGRSLQAHEKGASNHDHRHHCSEKHRHPPLHLPRPGNLVCFTLLLKPLVFDLLSISRAAGRKIAPPVIVQRTLKIFAGQMVFGLTQPLAAMEQDIFAFRHIVVFLGCQPCVRIAFDLVEHDQGFALLADDAAQQRPVAQDGFVRDFDAGVLVLRAVAGQ